jgi:zinc protease
MKPCSRRLVRLSAAALPLLLLAGAFAAEPKDLPKPAEMRPMTFAAVREKTLENGLRIVAVERHGQPLVTACLLLKSGAESDPADRAGLTSFVASLLTRGTKTRSATQIAQDLEILGASVQAKAEWDATTAWLTTLAPSTGAALEILADVVRNPALAPEEIERLRKEQIDEVQVQLEQPTQLARVVAAPLILGPSPYAHKPEGTPAPLGRITREDVVAHHAKVFRPESAALIIAGDLKADDAFSIAEKAFGSWKAETDAAPAKLEKTGAPEPSVTLVDMPDAGQAAVYVGSPQEAHSSGTFAVSQVANTVLGGGYSSRLNREVRVKRGLSYGCGSKISAWRAGGIFSAACQTKNESAAEVIKVIRSEIERLGAAPVPEEEFLARRLVVTGGFQRDLQTNEGYARRIAEFIVRGEPVDAFAATLARYNSVTVDDVQKFAASQLTADRLNIIVVGKASVCEKSLKELFPKLRVIPQSKLEL